MANKKVIFLDDDNSKMDANIIAQNANHVKKVLNHRQVDVKLKGNVKNVYQKQTVIVVSVDVVIINADLTDTN